jgi:large subunit ribosomal protein L25
VKISKGLISHVRSAIEVTCLPKDLPEFVTVDLSGLTAHSTLRVLDIQLPEGVQAVIHGSENPAVISVITKGGAATAEAEEAAE